MGIILNIDDIEKYKADNFIDDLYKIKIVPLIKEQAKRIDDDIRVCIKKEIKEYGSIIKRYGDWAKFITKEIGIVRMPNSPNCYFDEKLYYRGKFIREYKIIINYN